MATRILSMLILVLLPTAALAVPSHGLDAIQTTESALPEGLDESDWRAIRTQVVAQQQAPSFRAVREPSGGSHAATNPVHGFGIRYSDDGTTELEIAGSNGEGAPSHRISLKPLAFGYGDSLETLANPVARSAADRRVDTVWDSQLREWWVNSAGGLEQWFELAEPPAGRGKSPLRLELALDTTLNAELAGMGEARHLLLHDGATRVRFEKLLVEDATGQRLSARMQLEGNRLAYVIDDREAVYPVTIDPTFVQQAYLKASNTDADDQFGVAIAVSGDTVVIGAPFEDSNATGVDGDQSDNSAENSGAAYVFVRSGGTWSQQAYLKASNTGAGDQFGISVAVSGDTVIVGADLEDSDATGVNGNQNSNLAVNSGAAYVFVRSGSTWSQQAYLKASNTDQIDGFGESLAISGDTVVVGARREQSTATGVDGDQSNNLANNAGAAYVFVRSGSTWSQQAYLKASNTDAADNFGQSVAVSNNTIVVGAFGEDSNATGVDGDQTDNSADLAGAAYVFTRSGGSWSQQAYLKASNTDAEDQFGRTVAVSGDTVVVGAWLEDSNATGVDGDQSSNAAGGAGAAYVFDRSGSTWSQQAYLKASNTGVEDNFGLPVAISGDRVVVGAAREDSGAVGINGDQSNNAAINSGAAYVFMRSGGTWSQQAYVKASNTDGADLFGTSVAVSGDTIVFGASLEESSDTGVNGDQGNNSANNAGAAYALLSLPLFTIGGDVAGLVGSGLVLQNSGSDDLAIAANGPFTFPTGLPNGTRYGVTVLDQPTSPNQTCSVANGSGEVAGANVTNVQVTCVDEPPELGLSADSLDFGAVFGGDTVTKNITVTSTGTGDLVISSIGLPSAPFDVIGGSCLPLSMTLMPGEICDIEITFSAPSTFGSFSDELTIVSNAPSSPDTVTLSGTVQPLVIPALNLWSLLVLILMIAALALHGLRGKPSGC